MNKQELAEGGVVAEGLSRSFGAERAVVDVDLVVQPGEVHAIIGLNGAGKTTLMRLLLGMLRPDSGRALILGHDVRQADREVFSHVGHLIEARSGYPELTVTENLQAAARLYGLNRAAGGLAAERLIEQLLLTRWADRQARALSAGNRQRLGLGCALICDPLVLVLDEPTNALDPAGVVLVRQLLHEAAVRGTAILVSSHHLDEVARTADYIHVMHRGRLVGSLEPHGVELERRFFELILAFDQAQPEPSR
jgi:ABC-2 type transport system ATP-binding protein